jgi:hypothetical protein
VEKGCRETLRSSIFITVPVALGAMPDFIIYRRQITSKRNRVMLTRYTALCSVLGVIAFQGTSAHALSLHECSVKYQAAKTAGTLNGMRLLQRM